MAKQSLWRRLAGVMEIPEELVSSVLRLTLLGNRRIVLENHAGIIAYTPTEIKVRLKDKAVMTIRGEKMTLESMQNEQILIAGKIIEIRYIV